MSLFRMRRQRYNSCTPRTVCDVADCRGVGLLTSIFVMFVVGLMLLAFQFVTKNEAQFAGLGRNNVEAFALADAGIAEALTPPRLSAAIPGVTTFTNSLVRALSGSGGTVAYQSCLPGLCFGTPTIFPILSTATFGETRRKVRVLAEAAFQPGFGISIVGPTVSFGGDASQTNGDIYAPSRVAFLSYPTSPQCASPTKGKTLLPPEVLAGTTIVLGDGHGQGSVFSPTNCPPPLVVKSNGTMTSECQTYSVTEVAPTSCAVLGGRAVPYHWHPMTPVGMPPADFATVVGQHLLPPGMSVVQATQDGAGVLYEPAGTYTPPYWTGVLPGPVLLIVAAQPFCVSAPAHAVVPVSPPYPGSCQQIGAGFRYYGSSQDAMTPLTTRFVDWGLVQDDLRRSPHAATFFQAPAAPENPKTFTCSGDSAMRASPGAAPVFPGVSLRDRQAGNPCGIRYIPVLPAVEVSAQDCGATAFDLAVPHEVTVCANTPVPPGGVTFTGTRVAPETLVIDNTGAPARGPLHVAFSIPAGDIPPSTPCGRIRFDQYNAGVILAHGDIVLSGSGVFTGFIYATGNVITQGTLIIRGGIFAANSPGAMPAVNGVSSAGAVNFCAAQSVNLPLSPQFFTLRTLAWQDVPLNQP